MCFKTMQHYINYYFYINKCISCEDSDTLSCLPHSITKWFIVQFLNNFSNICYFNNIPLFKAPVVPIPGDQVWSRCFLFIPPELLPLFISCDLFWFDTAWIILYPMLRADSRFWLVNNREIWRRISRLTSSAWDIKTKERHWWRHNGDSDRRPLSLPLRYDLVTLRLYGDLGQINVIAGILKLRKCFRMSQILFEHGINSLPLVCFRGYGNLSTLSIAIPRLAFGRAWYCDAACGYIPVSASANKG